MSNNMGWGLKSIADKFRKGIYTEDELSSVIGNINNPLLDMPLNNSLSMKQGVGEVTFTRDTIATYIDRYGILQYAAVDEPRFEKDGFLVEGESTNLCLQSEDFNTTWNWQNITPVSKVAPDGSNNAYKLEENSNT